MKKIIIIAVSALTALLASCNMDKFPHGAILEEEGVKTMQDAAGFRVGLYTPMKSLLGGARYTMEEIRGGMFHAMVDYGNVNGSLYRWEMTSTEPTAESLWYGDYAAIVSVNYTIDAYKKLLDDEKSGLSEEDKATLQDYYAEAHLTRAMLYWDLVTKFCVAYDPLVHEEGNDKLGLPLQTAYNPSSDVTTYPGRSSLLDTYKLIEGDLLTALDMSAVGQANNNYYSKDLVKALLARLYLNMQDYPKAASYAEEVILSNRYTLAKDDAELESLFISDISKELIFVVYGELNDPPTSTGSLFINDNKKGTGENPDPFYIPSQTLLNLYDKANDMRYPLFFQTHEIEAAGQDPEDLELLWKFVGNPIYQKTTGVLNYINAGKIRISEMYLTLAEAAAMLKTDEGLQKASNRLNELRATRIKNYVDEEYDSSNIMTHIKAEWSREFVGEGFRMINLKRWKDDLTHGEPQSVSLVYNGSELSQYDKPITHSRAIWPIPKREMDVNPQMKGQQNLGY